MNDRLYRQSQYPVHSEEEVRLYVFVKEREREKIVENLIWAIAFTCLLECTYNVEDNRTVFLTL